MDKTALFKLTYGLYVLTVKEEKDNGCIIDTVMQITEEPQRLAICVNRNHLTNEMIKKTKIFNLSVITTDAKKEMYARFGYQSGRDVDKFKDFSEYKRGKNGISYITKDTNAYLECIVEQAIDYETHTLFIASIQEAERLKEQKSVTYAQYREEILK